MRRNRIIQILEESLLLLSDKLALIPKEAFPLKEETTLERLGITPALSQVLMHLIENRIGLKVNFKFMLVNQEIAKSERKSEIHYSTVGHMVTHIESSIHHHIRNPLAVYVDSKVESIGIFEKNFQHRMNLKTFEDPLEACHFILRNPEVVLVITREKMPVLSGEKLRKAIHQQKPYLKIILLADPFRKKGKARERAGTSDERFNSVLKSPLDFENRGYEYFAVFNEIISGNFF